MNALSVRFSSARARAVADLAAAAASWGSVVPGDPGIGELADILGQAADHLQDGWEERAEVAAGLAMAVEELRAAARLGGLLPLVVCHHLWLALQHERSARQALDRAALPVTWLRGILGRRSSGTVRTSGNGGPPAPIHRGP